MSVHEQFADDLALFALGTLEGESRVAVEAHLGGCPECRQELERLRGDAALLAFSASGPRPPSRSRERLMKQIAREPRRVEVRPAPRRVWWSALQWAAAGAMVVVVVLLVRQNSELQRSLAIRQASSAMQEQQLREAKQLLTTLTAPDATRFVLVAGTEPPQPQGRLIYASTSGTLVFLASNMPKLPPHEAYELWLIPTTGAPIPAGVFQPNRQGSAAVVKPPLRAGIEAKTFAITVEPEAGSAAPTSQPVMVGTPG